MLALIDHGSEFYRKGKWPINTNHGWKILGATKATEDLFAACPDVTVKIGDVEIDQNFFVQDEVSHSSAYPLSRLHGWRQRCWIAVRLLREFGVKTDGNPSNS